MIIKPFAAVAAIVIAMPIAASAQYTTADIASRLRIRIEGKDSTWTGTWVRRGKSNTYDAIPNDSKGNRYTVKLVSVNGRRVVFEATSNETTQRYSGEIGGRGSSSNAISGTYSDSASGSRRLSWSGEVDGTDGGGRDPGRDPGDWNNNGPLRPGTLADTFYIDISSPVNWRGRWTRTNGNIYRAVSDDGGNTYMVKVKSVSGNHVEFETTGASVLQTYSGDFSSNRRTITGTMNDRENGYNRVRFTASTRGNGSGNGNGNGGIVPPNGGGYTTADIAPVLYVDIDTKNLGGGGWHGVWKRDGKSNHYTAVPSRDSDNQFDVDLISVRGNRVEFMARGASRQRYTGTISSDAFSISGTLTEVKTGRKGSFTMRKDN